MKTFKVYLHDGRIATILADTYRHDGNQYVFDKTGDSELQFFVDSEVVGISSTATQEMPEASPLEEGNLPLLAKAEQEAIRKALAECDGNRTQAARMLGISRRGLINKLKNLPDGDLPSCPQ